MKKYMLLFVVLSTNSAYSKLPKEMNEMMPIERKNLALSMKEVSEFHKKKDHNTKAKEYLRVSLELYPIGDDAYVSADQLGLSLNDDDLYNGFIKSGDDYFAQKEYKSALANYLMAQELKTSSELYCKISDAYAACNNSSDAEFYKSLSQSATFSCSRSNDSLNSKTSRVDAEQLNDLLQDEFDRIDN